jgi:hypothetical protein
MDLRGQRFGRLGVIRKVRRRELRPPLCDEPNSFWHCACECGNACIVRGSNLARGITLSCGCYQRELWTVNRKRPTDLRGLRFGRLDVVRRVRRSELPPPLCDEPHSFWHCRCQCGNACIVRGSNLARTLSCGCYKREVWTVINRRRRERRPDVASSAQRQA